MNSENTTKDVGSKQLKLKIGLKNLKSDYFLNKVFDIIKRNKSLEIVKYNEKLQERLNLSINDYKEYSQLYSPIEIELNLVDNKFGKFINISDNDKEYYHIYFDNLKEETKTNNLKENEKIEKIKIIIDYQIKSFKRLFKYCKCISSIFFKKFNRINITDMSYMFFGCSSLKELNLNNFNTNNVTSMESMFKKCSDDLKRKIKSENKNIKDEAFY